MKIQEYLELAMQDLLQARTYITTNTIPVVRYKDFNTDREELTAVVSCNSINRIAPNYDKYECPLEIRGVSRKQKDLIGASSDDLTEDLQDEVYQTLSVATLQAAVNAVQASSGVTIDGLVNLSTEDEETDEFNVITLTTNVYLTFVKP
jgi:hypothetical protein